MEKLYDTSEMTNGERLEKYFIRKGELFIKMENEARQKGNRELGDKIQREQHKWFFEFMKYIDKLRNIGEDLTGFDLVY